MNGIATEERKDAARPSAKANDRLLKISDVLSIIPMSRPTLYREIKAGRFPAPIKWGRRSYWSLNAINSLIDELKEETA